MNSGGKGAITNSRGLFSEAHGTGKGDKPRDVDKKKYDTHFDVIDWEDRGGSKRQKVVVTKGKRTITHYR